MTLKWLQWLVDRNSATFLKRTCLMYLCFFAKISVNTSLYNSYNSSLYWKVNLKYFFCYFTNVTKTTLMEVIMVNPYSYVVSESTGNKIAELFLKIKLQ